MLTKRNLHTTSTLQRDWKMSRLWVCIIARECGSPELHCARLRQSAERRGLKANGEGKSMAVEGGYAAGFYARDAEALPGNRVRVGVKLKSVDA